MRRVLMLLIGLVLSCAATRAQARSSFVSWADLHRGVTSWRLDSLSVARVQSLILQRDAGAIVLEEGRLALARPLGGRVCAAAFQGTGSISYTPRSALEREQMRRMFGRTTVRRAFTQLLLVFADTTLNELQSSLHFAPETLGTLNRVWRDLEPHLTDRDNEVLRPLAVAFTLANADTGLFWASAWTPREEPLYLIVDPYATEGVQLQRRPKDDRRGLWRLNSTEVVSRQVREGDPDTSRTDVRAPFAATAYHLQVAIGSDLKASVSADVTVEAKDRSCEWLPFALHPHLRLGRVTLDNAPVVFHQEKDRNAVWVHLAPALEPGAPKVLRFEYRGEMLERLEDDWLGLPSTSDWYPRAAFMQPATWDLELTHPAGMQSVASGVRTENRLEGSRRHTRWVQEHPSALAAFDLGYFRGIEVVNDSLPPLTVWTHHVAGAGRVERRTMAELGRSRRYDDGVALDVARAVLSMQRLGGRALAPTLNAIETPRLRFEAFPGLIHLMPLANKSLPGAQYSPELYRYHEIAHQWWGLGVEPARDRDTWLAEGFASFLSIYHPATALAQPVVYSTVLAAWRDQMESNRRYLFGDGQEAGPIALGTRVHSSSTPGDRQTVLYMKSAWVLDRLRCKLRDAREGDARFERILRAFSERYSGRRARTEDFLHVAEEITGNDLHPFFQKYVYGTDELDFTPCP
ncbi:MAG: M1 family aminopeptidase [Candidatus Eisenbacteria bacterium]